MSPTNLTILSRAVPNLAFQSTGDLTTCQSARIQWQLPAGTSSAEASSPIDISLTSTTPFATADGTLTTTKPLVSGLPAVALGFNWASVNVPQGTYSLMATVDPGTRAQQIFTSSLFSVVEGPDTSCVPAESPGAQGGSGLSAGVIAIICIAAGIVTLSVPGIYFLLIRRARARRRDAARRSELAESVFNSSAKFPVDAKTPTSVYGGGRSSAGTSPTTTHGHGYPTSPSGSPPAWRESSTFSPTPISPPPRRTSLPKLLSPIRREPDGKDDVLPPVPESPDNGVPRPDAVPNATNTNPKSEPDAESSLVVPTPLHPVRRSKSSKRPVPLYTTTTDSLPSSSSSASAQPADISSDDDASGAPLSRTTTNTTFTSLLSRSVPSIFRKSIPHQPAVYSAAKPESVFGMYVGPAKEGFDGRSAKSRPNSYYPTPARSPSPRFPSGVSTAASSHWAPPSAWSSSNSPQTPTQTHMHSPTARSFRSAGKQAARSSTLSVGYSVGEDGASMGSARVQPLSLPPIPPLPRPLPQPGMYRTGSGNVAVQPAQPSGGPPPESEKNS